MVHLQKLFWRFLPIALIIIIVSLAIFYKFTQIPDQYAFDEVEFIKLALSLKDSPYTVYSPLATGHSTLYFYVILAFFNLFGVSQFSLRLASALSGVVSILFFYKLMSFIFSNYQLPIASYLKKKKLDWLISISLGFVLSLTLATSRWFFSFARYSFEATFLLMLELISLYLAFVYVKSKKISYLFLSAIFAGLAFHSYTPGRIFIIVTLVFLILSRVGFKKIMIYLSTWFIIIFPLLMYFQFHGDARFNNQMFLKNSEMTLTEKATGLTSNIVSNTAIFFIPGRGDANGRHNYPLKPAVNPVLFGLFCLGLLTALRNITNKYNITFGVYFAVAMLPTLLTYPWENPNMLRSYTVLPSLVYFAGCGIKAVFEAIEKWVKKRELKQVLNVGLLILIVLSMFYELRTYFLYQARDVIPHAFDVEADLEKLQ